MEVKSKIIRGDEIGKKVSLEGQLSMGEALPASAVASGKKVLTQDGLKAASSARKIIEDAVHEAHELKEKSRELYLQVSDKMDEARKQGFEQGREEGLASVTEQLVALRKQNEELLNHIEKEAVSLVGEIAQKIIGETIAGQDDAIMGLVRQALQSSLGNELTIFVSPGDYERLRGHESKLTGVLSAMQNVQLKPSENVSAGGCVIESELGTIDAQLEVQMAAIKRALEV